MRIAIDIDSTLHHYWLQLEQVARERYGVALDYATQTSWGIAALAPDQLHACVAETHGPALVEAAEPYPGAVAVVRAWHDAGHYIHITSHRTTDAQAATERWLRRIGLPYDDLHLSWDKIARCRELGIELLVDDSPVNLARALEAGMAAATLQHPWNGDLCRGGAVACAPDWPTLQARLAPLLAGRASRPAPGGDMAESPR